MTVFEPNETPPLILIADDDPSIVRLLADRFSLMGFKVETASNGRQALRRVRQGGVDALIVDIQMPELDGIEATQQIRQAEKTTVGHVPIVAMTAHAMAEDRGRCLEAGMDDYLSKPINRKELLAALARQGANRAAGQVVS